MSDPSGKGPVETGSKPKWAATLAGAGEAFRREPPERDPVRCVVAGRRGPELGREVREERNRTFQSRCNDDARGRRRSISAQARRLET